MYHRSSESDYSLHILIILQKTPPRPITPWEFVFSGPYAAIRKYCSMLMWNVISTSHPWLIPITCRRVLR